MVEIKYCPQCHKAKREHLFKTGLCQFCGSETVTVEAKRTRYFFFMLPFLILGAIFHLYTVYNITLASEKPDPSVTLGLVLLGIGMYIIAIGFQVLDSKHMEKEAADIGPRHAKSPRRSPWADAEPEQRPRTGGSVRVHGPKRPTVKGPPAPREPSAEDEKTDKAQEEENEAPSPPKKEIPVKRPKEKKDSQEAKKEAEAPPAKAGVAKTKKGKPSGSKGASTGKAPKHSPPKARKILTR